MSAIKSGSFNPAGLKKPSAGLEVSALMQATTDFDNSDAERYGTGTDSEARDAYQQRYSGMQAIGELGLTRLEELINSAIRAREQSTARAKYGAAVMTVDGKMFSGCNVESGLDVSMNVSAERSAIVNAVSQGETQFESLVLCSDQEHEFPSPDGVSRQFMAGFGNFSVFLLKADLTYKQYTTRELYPVAPQQAQKAHSNNDPEPGSGGRSHGNRPANPSDWSAAEVANWMTDSVGLPEYSIGFRTGAVDGAMLLQLQDVDLEQLLAVRHSLHRRRILEAVDRLRRSQLELQDRERRERQTAAAGTASAGDGATAALNPLQLNDYLTVLDQDRVKVITRLKAAFDHVLAKHEGGSSARGAIELLHVGAVFEHLGAGSGPAESDEVTEAELLTWLAANGSEVVQGPNGTTGTGRLNFEALACAYTELLRRNQAQQERVRDRGAEHAREPDPELEARVHAQRIQQLKLSGRIRSTGERTDAQQPQPALSLTHTPMKSGRDDAGRDDAWGTHASPADALSLAPAGLLLAAPTSRSTLAAPMSPLQRTAADAHAAEPAPASSGWMGTPQSRDPTDGALHLQVRDNSDYTITH